MKLYFKPELEEATPTALAVAFLSMDADDQAVFFNAITQEVANNWTQSLAM